MLTLTAAQCRALDNHLMHTLGVPGLVLMENAGRNIAHHLLSLGINGPVVIGCGKGNNGGDGFVIARHLDIAGVAVQTLLFTEPESLAGDAAVNHAILKACGLTIEVMTSLDEMRLDAIFSNADWIVDALFGSGLKGEIRSPFDRIIQRINASGTRVLAVDIPSGLEADTGRPLGIAVRATHTVTVAALKTGFVQPEAREWVGELHVVDMGVPARLVAAVMGEREA